MDLDYHRVEMDEGDAIPGTFSEKNPFTELVKANSMKQLEYQRKARARIQRGNAVLDVEVQKQKQKARAATAGSSSSNNEYHRQQDNRRRALASSPGGHTGGGDIDQQQQNQTVTTTRGIPLRLSTPDQDDDVPPGQEANARARDGISRFFQLGPGGDNDGDTEPAPSRFAFTPATPPPPSMLGEHITVQTNDHQQHHHNHQNATATNLKELHAKEQEENHRRFGDNYHGRKFPVTKEEILELIIQKKFTNTPSIF